MLHDQDIPSSDGKFASRRWIIESSKELSTTAKIFPDSADLPTTHEFFVKHEIITRNGQNLTTIEVGVRPKATAATAPIESDKLNEMSDAALEEEAAKAGVTNYPKNAARAKRVALIREARTKQPAGV